MAVKILHPTRSNGAGILVVHSWWGRTTSFLKYGSALAQEGSAVGVSDLFNGQVATSENEARALKKRRRRVPMYRTLESDQFVLRHATQNDDPKIGIVGFSMGGHWAVWFSQRPEYEISATVLCYAARGGDFSRCNSSIQAHFAENDVWMSRSARRNMEKAIREAGCPQPVF